MADHISYAVPALDKCFEIMEYLATVGAPLSQSEISKGLTGVPTKFLECW